MPGNKVFHGFKPAFVFVDVYFIAFVVAGAATCPDQAAIGPQIVQGLQPEHHLAVSQQTGSFIDADLGCKVRQLFFLPDNYTFYRPRYCKRQIFSRASYLLFYSYKAMG